MYTQYGKPHTNTYAFAEAMLQAHLEQSRGETLDRSAMSVCVKRCNRPGMLADRLLRAFSHDPPPRRYMIGDNPESDIAGAIAHGWSSCLLRTGVYAGGTPRHAPTTICDDVEVAVDWAIEREVERVRREDVME